MSGEHKDIEKIAARCIDAANKLTKWRSVFAGWQLGTRPDTDGPTRAVRDHREVTILLRAEVNALTRVLLDKGIVTQVEWTETLAAELEHLDRAYEKKFPGFESTEHGMALDVQKAGDTMRLLGFPR